MQEWEIGPAQLKAAAAVVKETWSLTQAGSGVKSTGSSGPRGERAEEGVEERRSATRRRNGMGGGWSRG